jgi:hypothetical protein
MQQACPHPTLVMVPLQSGKVDTKPALSKAIVVAIS